MRLLLTADAVGGVWQYATDLARALQGRGVEVLIALLGPAPSASQREAARDLTLIDTGLQLDWLAETPEEVRAAGDALALLAQARQVDLVQLNAPALAAGSAFDVPVVAVSHSCLLTWWESVIGGALPENFRWRVALHDEGLRASSLVVTPSSAFAEATREAYVLRTAPHVIHNGRAPLALPEVAPHDFAFTAGRLWDKGKNLATLDRAAAALAVPLYAAGPETGPDGETISFQHARPVGVVGERELARRLAARPVFVSAALYEPFGLAVLEAASAGCPLVLSDIPTFRELWDGAATFVKPLDDAGFAAAISRTIGDDLARAEWGRKAKERAARYNVNAMAADMLVAYRGVLAAKTGQARAAA
ncbi:MAG TPA: glycosyltransferase family 4 protein [Allosphingosinicella sp.]|uniref:glycosyltransferase family 4 protein n=1 Tax=Allosphingosinicella sp. TaxID=2823234 RepID=UPI002F2AE6ED